ncbi:MAG: DUF3060 domain-containing protein [Mycolicibacterium sp.]|uniref:DUF3060 domain-containing protein n=1 Tax=Mycolicibacterium sp. TaxID=2320850 RepID=UPI0009296385|nr:DUF3060 domain-containing protein [Mycolicibacterium sp.]RUP33589.1 MAG: DUF3060 domain-containing protein [Mycolicibacterium sp.]SHT85016.1 putative conserved membrane protein [Mycobacteroides abscessus subsp. abscessus]
MSRDDDPEARIRELERAMNDQARASELTEPGHAWSSRAAAPSNPYPAQYHRPQTTWPPQPLPPGVPTTAARRMILGVVVLAVIVGPVVAAIIFVTNLTGKKHVTFLPPSSDRRPSVSVAVPTPPGDESSVVVNGTTVQSGPGLVELPPVSGDPNAPIRIAGVRGHRTLACNDRPVNISGVSNSVTITGHCSTVEVSGIENTVTVDSADKITTSGMDNHVIYHSGTPEIPTPSGSNTVSRG